MVEKIIVHKIPVALIVLVRETKVFIHVECYYIGKRYLARLVHSYEFLVNTNR